MQTKYIQDFELKVEGDGKTISGYGSVFGNADLGGDIVVSGAFAKSIASGRKPKMLFQHNPNEVIGVWNSFAEDEKGLRVEGTFANTPRGQEMKELVRVGAIEGLSIGYKTVDQDFKGSNRYIKTATLYEISLVTFPMNEEATIDSIKAAEMTIREMENKLRDAGFSKSVAQSLLSGGFDAIRNEEKTDNELIDLLKRRAEIAV